jgi:signal transduction histidine kinase
MLVISDIVMPEMDGFELCRKIKRDQDLKETPVMLLTALSDPEDVLRGLECGADYFITKPYNGADLCARIRHMLVNAKLRRESKTEKDIELSFKGQKYVITSERRQILDLLLSTYETAVAKNHELNAVQEKLRALNEHLEIKVQERTAALMGEIEERRKAEEEIKRLNEELEQRVAIRTAELRAANRELESFAYSVSHDLRAPLRIIDGFSRAIEEDHSDRLDDPGRDYLRRVRGAAFNMAQLIDALLNLSRTTRAELKRVRVDLSALASATAEELGKAEPARRVDFFIARGVSAEGDPAMLQVAIDNLVRNAWKFTGNHPTARVEFGVIRKDGKSVFFVRDDGAGFDQDYADRMFVPFQRLHSASEFPGIGIGLATVQRIIHRHGGEIWAEGALEKGATFYFTL